MKKFLARFSLLGLFAGLALSSYAVPANAAAVDQNTTYQGPTSNSEDAVIVIIIGEDYYWVEVYGVADNTNALAPSSALTDAAFDK
ncbi:MAG TPA: hypothetical protein VF815_11065 [Myxococcaceae bacterium]|jgi:hypothetical protein